MPAKDITAYFSKRFKKDIDWVKQTSIAKRLLTQFSEAQLKYAIDYYCNRGENVYSLGFFNKKTMQYPLTVLETEMNNKTRYEGSEERNWERINKYNEQTKHREEYPRNLFEEPREDNRVKTK